LENTASNVILPCVYTSMCLHQHVSTPACVYTSMCLHKHVSTPACVYTSCVNHALFPMFILFLIKHIICCMAYNYELRFKVATYYHSSHKPFSKIIETIFYEN